MTARFPEAPLRVKKGVELAVRAGMPWVYASEVVDSSELSLLAPGSLVSVETLRGERLAIGYYNAHSQIACRILTLTAEPITADWFRQRMERALTLREKAVGVPYYRLVHSEGDFLPGLLLDRFGDVLVAQSGTAGMDALAELWMDAARALVRPSAIVLRNDTAARAHEGLVQAVHVVEGEVAALVQVVENGCLYLADVLEGQKTGWFFDQRDNRQRIAEKAHGKTLVDIYSHSGGFGLLAARAGAQVTLVDSSKLALDIAQQAAALNGVTVEVLQGDAFAVMEAMAEQGRRFDIVLADPPAFVKSKKDIASGLKGYAKVARLAVALSKPGGLFFTASCSHYAGRSAFNKAVLEGVAKAGCAATVLAQTGAGCDHPVHPKLAQGEYLKGILLEMDCDPR